MLLSCGFFALVDNPWWVQGEATRQNHPANGYRAAVLDTGIAS